MGQHDCEYRALLEQTPAIMYVADFGADYALRCISPQVEEILGYAAADWLASPEFWVERLHPDDRERVVAAAEAAIAERRGLELEYRMLRPDGRPVWLWERTTILRAPDGAPESVHGAMLEITPRKEAEAREAAIMEAALGTIVQLAEALGMTTVGERIETEAQRALLLDRGCLLGQGYLLGRPVPASALTASRAEITRAG
jgi:PAS domain S-box-containing protein